MQCDVMRTLSDPSILEPLVQPLPVFKINDGLELGSE